jgi:DNA-binding response OmpR family regulator
MSINSERVLVVDDEPNIRLVFRTALEPSGYSVDEAGDGLEALEHLAAATADVVVLDLQMPGLGGMDFLRRLRDLGDETPVVVVTAYGTVPDAVEAMRLGAIDFLSKPLSPEALRRVVGEVLARHAEPVAAVPRSPTARPATAPTAITVGPVILDLTEAKRALNRREFDRAVDLLEEALAAAPDSAEAHTLLGVLYEARGQDHAAYHAYRAALTANPFYAPARDNLRRYCERFGLDVHNRAINPAAD